MFFAVGGVGWADEAFWGEGGEDGGDYVGFFETGWGVS